MSNRKFKMKPQSFLLMALLAPAGVFFLYRGWVTQSNDPLIMGAGSLLISLVLFLTQWVRIPAVTPEVQAEIERSYPADQRRNVLVTITNAYSETLMANSVHMKMLKYANGDLNRLHRLTRGLHGNEDFRDVMQKLEGVNSQLDRR